MHQSLDKIPIFFFFFFFFPVFFSWVLSVQNNISNLFNDISRVTEMIIICSSLHCFCLHRQSSLPYCE